MKNIRIFYLKIFIYFGALVKFSVIYCGYLLELPHGGSSNEYLQSMF